MARIRTIKPDSAVSLSVQGVSIEARYFFQNVWCHLDDEGRMEWLPKKLLGDLFPSENDHYTIADLNRWLAELEGKSEMLRSYTVAGSKYVDAPAFLKHQVINRPTPSKHPPFEPSLRTHGVTTEDSWRTHGGLMEGSLPERKGKEQGMEGKGTGNGKEQGMEGKENLPLEEKRKDKSRPTVLECGEYALKISLPESEAVKFFDFYASKGWLVGKSPMKDFEAAMRGWKSRSPNLGNRQAGGKLSDYELYAQARAALEKDGH